MHNMVDFDEASDSSSGRRTKVARLIDEYSLDSIGTEMENLWTRTDSERLSLRDLAEYFNQQLLAEAMAKAGVQPLDGEIENTYRLLSDDDVSSADRTRTRRRLERDGVDVETLLTDFVTYQAVRTYLKDHRGAEYTGDERARTVVETENIQRLQGRIETVVESKLQQLRNADNITLGKFRPFVEVSILCEDCGKQYEITELLEQGGCECQSPQTT